MHGRDVDDLDTYLHADQTRGIKHNYIIMKPGCIMHSLGTGLAIQETFRGWLIQWVECASPCFSFSYTYTRRLLSWGAPLYIGTSFL